MDEVALLEEARANPGLAQAIVSLLGVDTDALDVPLHELDFAAAVLSVGGTDIPVFAVKVDRPCVGRDATGRLFLAREGDWLLRSPSGYALLRGL